MEEEEDAHRLLELERARSLAAVARVAELEVQNAVLSARIDALEHGNRFCREEKADLINRMVQAEQRARELESRPDLSEELAQHVRELETRLVRVRSEAAEQIMRATTAERRADEMEERVEILEAMVERLEAMKRFGLAERAAHIRRAVLAEQRAADLEARMTFAV